PTTIRSAGRLPPGGHASRDGLGMLQGGRVVRKANPAAISSTSDSPVRSRGAATCLRPQLHLCWCPGIHVLPESGGGGERYACTTGDNLGGGGRVCGSGGDVGVGESCAACDGDDGR